MTRATLGNTLFGPGAAPRQRRTSNPRAAVPTWRQLDPGAVLLAIDPSISACGYAMLRNTSKPELIDAGVIRPVDSDDRSRFDHLSLRLAKLIKEWREKGEVITDCIIEIPRGGGKGGLALSYYYRAVGICEGTCYRAGLRMNRVSVSEWKGRSDKRNALLVVRNEFPAFVTTENNTIDAIAIGLWHFGMSKLRMRAG
jgi:Holliday junction resolvasome RuvABC endonuclease subunit